MTHFGVRAPRMTRPANTVPYAAGQLVANSTTAGSVVAFSFDSGSQAPVLLHSASMLSSNNTVTNKSYRLWLFGEAPTVTNGDGGALAVTANNALAVVAILASAAALSSGAGCYQVFEPIDSSATSLRRVPCVIPGRVWGLLQANAAYTPTSAETFDITLECEL